MKQHAPPVELLLFDLGNVLVRIDFGRAFAHWGRCAGVDPALLAQRFAFDDAYDRHERGEIDGDAYFRHVQRTLGIELPEREMARGWNRIFVGAIHETVSAVAALNARKAVFSNSNETHKRAWMRDYADQLAHFERVFVSSDMARRKPEAEAFLHIARETHVAPERVLFFDDLEANVQGARDVGMHGVVVRGPADVVDALHRYGVATPNDGARA